MPAAWRASERRKASGWPERRGGGGITVRQIDLKNFNADVERVCKFTIAWERNWGFVPMTREEFALDGQEMKQILKPELVLIGGGEVARVGFRDRAAGCQQRSSRRGVAIPHGISLNTVLSALIKASGSGAGVLESIARPAGGGFLRKP